MLIAWENEAYLAGEEFGPKFDIVYPSVSILAEHGGSLLATLRAKSRTLTGPPKIAMERKKYSDKLTQREEQLLRRKEIEI